MYDTDAADDLVHGDLSSPFEIPDPFFPCVDDGSELVRHPNAYRSDGFQSSHLVPNRWLS